MARLGRGLRGRELYAREKGGGLIGKTKRGKGTKCMVVVDGEGVPLGTSIHSASPAEVKLVEQTLTTIKVPRAGSGRPKERPARLIGDKAYDSDPLRERLGNRGIELIAPHRANRRRPKTQDGRALRRYRRRWKVERTFAWLQNFRRLVTRYERHPLMFKAFLHLACALITLRHL
jgi:transposase